MKKQAPAIAVNKANNFPPLPSVCCFESCFYHDISVDIPTASQKTCRLMFSMWKFFIICLFLNAMCGLITLCFGNERNFGLSILYLFVFTPASYVLWYRPIYRALRDSYFIDYLVFGCMYFLQILFNMGCIIGSNTLGFCGWSNMVTFATSRHQNHVIPLLFTFSAISFTILTIFMMLMLKRLYVAYRDTGPTFDEVKEHLMNGIKSHKNYTDSFLQASQSSGSVQSSRGFEDSVQSPFLYPIK